jgi:hypothetical protein
MFQDAYADKLWLGDQGTNMESFEKMNDGLPSL